MALRRTIPITPIWRRYQALRKASQKKRLAEAQRLVEHPDELATEFAASVAHFEPYDNVEDPFYPPTRPERAFAGDIRRTNDLVLRLRAQGRLVPTDADHRLHRHDAGVGVTPAPAASLACDYVDREILVQRTTSPAQWEDGRRNVGGVCVDVLLADAADRTPVVGEVKLPGDMDPFFALVQALTGAAHLATVPQYERMRRHLERGGFPELRGAPSLDVWLLFVDGKNGLAEKGRYMADLGQAAAALAPRLLTQDGIRDSVRRIAAVKLKKQGSAEVAAEVLWAWSRS